MADEKPVPKDAQVNIRLTTSDKNRIKEKAELQGLSFSGAVEQAVIDWLNEPPVSERTEWRTDPKDCNHPRLPKPGRGSDKSQCRDCGTVVVQSGLGGSPLGGRLA